MRVSMAALQRASLLARNTAIQTGTNLVIVKDGRMLRISPEELRQRAEPTDAPISSRPNPKPSNPSRPTRKA